MNVEVSNEEIEKMLYKAINERVKTWFGDEKNKYFIRDAIIKAVDKEVFVRVNESKIDIPKLVSSLSTKQLAKEITEEIGYSIASIFEEKYGD